MIERKLYKKYYPIKTEEEKLKFINDEKNHILRCMEKYLIPIKVEYEDRHMKYILRMKNTISWSGKVKYKNIIQNEIIARKRKFDRRLFEMEQFLIEKEKLFEKIWSDDEISIEEVNQILLIMKSMYEHVLFRFAAFVLLVGALAMYYLVKYMI